MNMNTNLNNPLGVFKFYCYRPFLKWSVAIGNIKITCGSNEINTLLIK